MFERPHALQTYLQREYWIQSALSVIRSRFRLCIASFCTRLSTLQPKMVPSSKYRVQQLEPFLFLVLIILVQQR